MNILDSAWLLKMLKKSGKTPKQRLLAIFDILADWVEAPNLRDQLQDSEQLHTNPAHLLDYLGEEAAKLGAHMPEALAQQLYFMSLSALQEYMRSSDPACFTHAKQACGALIKAQTEKEYRKPLIYGIAATVMIAVTAGLIVGYQFMQHKSTLVAQIPNPIIVATPAVANAPDFRVSPQKTAEMYARMEQMRQGDCQYVEALLIPDQHKKVYLENVVGGQVPDNARDQEIAMQYMKKVRCSYTPMLMKNSTN